MHETERHRIILSAVQVERFTGNLPPIRAFDPPG